MIIKKKETEYIQITNCVYEILINRNKTQMKRYSIRKRNKTGKMFVTSVYVSRHNRTSEPRYSLPDITTSTEPSVSY